MPKISVKEFCINHNDKPYWLCPSVVHNTSITPKPYECGMDFSSITFIPEYLINKQIDKVWIEDNKYCIIWINQ